MKDAILSIDMCEEGFDVNIMVPSEPQTKTIAGIVFLSGTTFVGTFKTRPKAQAAGATYARNRNLNIIQTV